MIQKERVSILYLFHDCQNISKTLLLMKLILMPSYFNMILIPFGKQYLTLS